MLYFQTCKVSTHVNIRGVKLTFFKSTLMSGDYICFMIVSCGICQYINCLTAGIASIMNNYDVMGVEVGFKLRTELS